MAKHTRPDTPPLWPDAFPKRSAIIVRIPTKTDIVDESAARALLGKNSRTFIAWTNREWLTVPGSFESGFQQLTVAHDVVASLRTTGEIIERGKKWVLRDGPGNPTK